MAGSFVCATCGKRHDGPALSWSVVLATRVPGYPDTDGLPATLRQRAPGLRPTVELDESDHPLAGEQARGITMGRVAEIGRRLEELRPSRPNAPEVDG